MPVKLFHVGDALMYDGRKYIVSGVDDEFVWVNNGRRPFVFYPEHFPYITLIRGEWRIPLDSYLS